MYIWSLASPHSNSPKIGTGSGLLLKKKPDQNVNSYSTGEVWSQEQLRQLPDFHLDTKGKYTKETLLKAYT